MTTPARVVRLLLQLQAPPDEALDEDDADDVDTTGPRSPWVPTAEVERMRTRSIGPNSNIDWKPSTGLRLRSRDRKFELELRTRVQLRYQLEHDHEGGETEHGLAIRRARFQLRGHLFDEHFKYYVQIAVSPWDLGWTVDGPSYTPVRDWQLSFDYLRDLTVTVGQMKVGYNRQRVISSGDLQLPDRALVNEEFTLDRDIGVKLHSDDLAGLGYLRYALGVFNGEGRDAYEVDDLGLLYVARIEVVPSGDAGGSWIEDEVDWARARTPSAVIGGAYAFHDRAKRDRGSLGDAPLDQGTTNFHHAQVDVMVRALGLSVSGEFHWRRGLRAFGDAQLPRTPPRTGIGYFVQAGFLIPRLPVELIGHWGQIFGLGDRNTTSLANSDQAGAGLSWYIARHSVELKIDYFRLRQDRDLGDPRSFSREPWSRSSDQVRIQLQMAF